MERDKPSEGHEMERVDNDENAVTGDTRIRVEQEGDDYRLVREKYCLVKFPGPSDDIEHEEYDWSREESLLLHGEEEAKQVAGLLSKAGAFDPNVLFFRQREYPDHD